MLSGRDKRHLDGHSDAKAVYDSSKAEAAKILGLSSDLKTTIISLQQRRDARLREQDEAKIVLNEIDGRIDRDLVPALRATKERLDVLIARRLALEGFKTDTEQADGLRAIRDGLEKTLDKPTSAKKTWAPIDPIIMQKFCKQIETVLRE